MSGKHLYFLIISIILAGCSGAMEGTAGKPDRVVVATKDAPAEAYRKAARSLLEKGYAIAQSDETLLTFTTEYRRAKRGVGLLNAPLHVKVSISISGDTVGVVTYRGLFRSSSIGDDEFPVVMRGMAGSPAMNAWDELIHAAEAYPGGILVAPRPPGR